MSFFEIEKVILLFTGELLLTVIVAAATTNDIKFFLKLELKNF